MSCTEIYAFESDGFACHYASVRNAWRGAMMVWEIMENRYLPPFVPDWVKYCNWYRPGMSRSALIERVGYEPKRVLSMPHGDDNPFVAIWDLADDPKVSEADRIVLYTTLDRVLVRREFLPVVINAFRSFGGETSLPEQADILDELSRIPTVIAVGWNQTSVSGHDWTVMGKDRNGNEIPYNCLTSHDHIWLFEDELVLSGEVAQNA